MAKVGVKGLKLLLRLSALVSLELVIGQWRGVLSGIRRTENRPSLWADEERRRLARWRLSWSQWCWSQSSVSRRSPSSTVSAMSRRPTAVDTSSSTWRPPLNCSSTSTRASTSSSTVYSAPSSVFVWSRPSPVSRQRLVFTSAAELRRIKQTDECQWIAPLT